MNRNNNTNKPSNETNYPLNILKTNGESVIHVTINMPNDKELLEDLSKKSATVLNSLNRMPRNKILPYILEIAGTVLATGPFVALANPTTNTHAYGMESGKGINDNLATLVTAGTSLTLSKGTFDVANKLKERNEKESSIQIKEIKEELLTEMQNLKDSLNSNKDISNEIKENFNETLKAVEEGIEGASLKQLKEALTEYKNTVTEIVNSKSSVMQF